MFPSIGYLPKLEKLYIRNNALTSLPAEISLEKGKEKRREEEK